MRPAKSQPAWWAPYGFAAIPTTTLDPPLRRRLPWPPRSMGPGPQDTTPRQFSVTPKSPSRSGSDTLSGILAGVGTTNA